MTLRVHLLRHAEPDYERAYLLSPKFEGHRRDFAPLTPAGRRAARGAADALRASHASVVITSPYTRTLETAHIVSAALGLPLEVDLNLHDWMAEKDGRVALDKETVDSAIIRYVRGDNSDLYETRNEVLSRMRQTLSALSARRVLEAIVVGHQEPICLLAGISELAPASWITRDFEVL